MSFISDLGDALDPINLVHEGKGERNKRHAARAARQAMTEQSDTLEGILNAQEGWTPDTYIAEPSLLAETYANPEDIAAQQSALEAMQDVYRSGGMTGADRDRLRLGQMEQAQAVRGQQQALQQNMAERGMGGSGAELAGLMSAQQGAQQGLYSQNAAMNVAAQQRALEAMRASHGMASEQRGSGFREGTVRSTAADRYNQYVAGQHEQASANRAATARDIYGARERLASMRTGQYQGDIDRARADRDAAARQRAANAEAAAGAVNAALDEDD